MSKVDDLPKASHRRLLTRSQLAWKDLTEPRLLIANVASSAGLTIPNIESIPHDLWFGDDLPALTFAEKATLLLAGFDMSFRFHQSSTQIVLTRFRAPFPWNGNTGPGRRTNSRRFCRKNCHRPM